MTVTERARDSFLRIAREQAKMSKEQRIAIRPTAKLVQDVLEDVVRARGGRPEVLEKVERLRVIFREPPEKEGEAGYLQEANGTQARDFATEAQERDKRVCMYAAMSLLEEKARAHAGGVYVVLLVENAVTLFSRTGVPEMASTMVWDIMTDPLTAIRHSITGDYDQNKFIEVESDAFLRMQESYLKADMPVSHLYQKIRKNFIDPQGLDPLKLPRRTINRSSMCLGVGEALMKDRQRAIHGRDDIQPIYASLHTVNLFMKDRFVYPSPSRGEEPLKNRTRVPRTSDMAETERNARAIDAQKEACKKGTCDHHTWTSLHAPATLPTTSQQ